MSGEDFLGSSGNEALVESLLDREDGDDGGLTLAKALLPLVEPTSPFGPWVCSTRYKTELCTSYSASGSCKYADRCQFAHGLRELRVPFRHPKYKTELCRSFQATGYCYYGNRCLFAHSPAEQRQTRRMRVPCRTFKSFGVCPFGTRCNFLHLDETKPANHNQPAPASRAPLRPRGALCRTFTAFGFCLYGTCCRFQHGLPDKLMTTPPAPMDVSALLVAMQQLQGNSRGL